MPHSESYRLRIHLNVVEYFDVFSPFAWTSLHLDTVKPWLRMDKFASRHCKTLALFVGHVLTNHCTPHMDEIQNTRKTLVVTNVGLLYR